MSELSREQRLNRLFVRLADSLVEGYDVVDLLQDLVDSCAELLDTDAGGLMLADRSNQLHVVASTSETAELVEIMQMNAGSGPCIECFLTGSPIAVPDIRATELQWREFAQTALAGGYRSVYATPLRLRGRTIGAMNLFSTHVGRLNDDDIQTARALSDVATIGILQERLIQRSADVTEQLQGALESRIFIEQAKGVLAEHLSLGMDDAFRQLRQYARSRGISLTAVAQSLANRSLDPGRVAANDLAGGDSSTS